MKIVVIVGLILLALCIAPLVVMWLWNGMLPDMFGFPEIGFWRAFGLMMLGQLLFGFKYTYKSNN